MALGEKSQYLDIDEYGTAISNALEFIKTNIIPPSQLLSPPPADPVLRDSGPSNVASSSSKELDELAAASGGKIPLAETHWIYGELGKDHGETITLRTKEKKFRIAKDALLPAYKTDNGKQRSCYTYIKDGKVCYT